MKKYTYEEVKKFVNDLGYELISKDYIIGNKKLILKDKDGYFYTVTFYSLKHGSSLDKFSKSNEYTLQNIIKYIELNDIEILLFDDNEYQGSNEFLNWKCLKKDCGEIFKATWHSIYIGQRCGYCVGQQVGLSNCLATVNPTLASEWHPTKNGSLTSFDVTANSNKKVWWQCSKNHKHEWDASINSRNQGKGCSYCSGRFPTEENNLLIFNPELCEEWNYNKNDKRPDEYAPNSNKKVWWICKECGNEWKTSVNNRNCINSRGCPECNKSKGEKECKRVFLSNNFIEITQDDYNKLLDVDKYSNTYFIPQKEFEGLIGLGGGLLSYDFYLPKYNLLVEYQGEYHDGTVKNQTKEDFERQVEHDRRKKEYSLEKKYNFLEIWYWDFDNIESILENTLINSVNNEVTVEYNIEQMVQSN